MKSLVRTPSSAPPWMPVMLNGTLTGKASLKFLYIFSVLELSLVA